MIHYPLCLCRSESGKRVQRLLDITSFSIRTKQYGTFKRSPTVSYSIPPYPERQSPKSLPNFSSLVNSTQNSLHLFKTESERKKERKRREATCKERRVKKRPGGEKQGGVRKRRGGGGERGSYDDLLFLVPVFTYPWSPSSLTQLIPM